MPSELGEPERTGLSWGWAVCPSPEFPASTQDKHRAGDELWVRRQGFWLARLPKGIFRSSGTSLFMERRLETKSGHISEGGCGQMPDALNSPDLIQIRCSICISRAVAPWNSSQQNLSCYHGHTGQGKPREDHMCIDETATCSCADWTLHNSRGGIWHFTLLSGEYRPP